MTRRIPHVLTLRMAGTPAVIIALLNVVVALVAGFRETAILLIILAVILVLPIGLVSIESRGAESAAEASGQPAELTTDELLSDTGDFTEDLDLTVEVGASAAGDRVLEQRSTRPHGEVSHRRLTLITPYAEPGAGAITVMPALEVKDHEVEADWHPLHDVAGRGAVVFTPPASGEALTWQLSYDMPGGIWNPLRTFGVDVFRYDVRGFPIGRFTVRFVLHPDTESAFVQERNQRGRVTDFSRDAEGRLVAVWTADDPAPRATYEWDLRVGRRTDRATPEHAT